MSVKVAGPASGRQLQQLFGDPQFRKMKELFCRAVLTTLKFKSAPGCARRLIAATEEGVAQGLDDEALYGKLHALVHDTLFLSDEYLRRKRPVGGFSREKDRTKQLAQILHEYLASRSGTIESYLDVGCNEGNITAAVGQLLKAKSTHGCDVFRPRESCDGFEFTLLDPENPYRLPYADKSQDVVTAFMSLHHIEQVDRTLDEIRRVLRDDGIFLIREHDCDPSELSLFLDLMHGFYAMVWANPREMDDFSSHYSNYRSSDEVTAVIEGQQGSPTKRFMTVFQGCVRGSWRHYYDVFVKGDIEVAFREESHAWFAGVPRKLQRSREAFRDRKPPPPSPNSGQLSMVLASEHQRRNRRSQSRGAAGPWLEESSSISYPRSSRRRRSRSRSRSRGHRSNRSRHRGQRESRSRSRSPRPGRRHRRRSRSPRRNRG